MAAAIASVVIVSLVTSEATAAYSEDYDPTFLMGNDVLDASGSMSVAQIQHYLELQSAECDTTDMPCLDTYRVATDTVRDGANICAVFNGSPSDSAAQIIAKAAAACRVNPKVLLALIESESGLVSAYHPTVDHYRFATGFTCGETFGCDPDYLTFFDQVFGAAWQLAVTRERPDVFAYKAGVAASVPFRDDEAPACGASSIKPKTRATAALYNYFWAQPDSWAITNLYSYDYDQECSSYRLRDFWRTYTDMFGPTTKLNAPRRVAQRDWTRDGYPDYFATASTGVLYGYFAIPGSVNIGRLKYGRGWKRMLFASTSYDLLGKDEMDLVAVTPTGDLNVYSISTNGAASGPYTLGTGFQQFDAVFGGTGWNDKQTGVIYARVAATGELLAYPAKPGGGLDEPVSLGTGWEGWDLLTFVGDIDGDGWNDLVARSKADSNLYLLRAGATEAYWGSAFRVGTGWGGMVSIIGAGDWNADGWLDFLGISSGGQLYRYLGDGVGGVASSMQVGKGWATFTPFP